MRGAFVATRKEDDDCTGSASGPFAAGEPGSGLQATEAILRSQQKPRFLLAETELMSEKAPQATFSNEKYQWNQSRFSTTAVQACAILTRL
jgi:hypothetical protein